MIKSGYIKFLKHINSFYKKELNMVQTVVTSSPPQETISHKPPTNKATIGTAKPADALFTKQSAQIFTTRGWTAQ